jgi:hypothetical protein
MLGKSFPSVARVVLPRSNACKLALVALAAALLAAGCGGSSGRSSSSKRVAGGGYSFRAPADWQVRRRVRAVEARDGSALVSVTTFPLARAFEPALWAQAVPELDRVARQLAATEHARLTTSMTTTLGGRKARVYLLVHDGVQEKLAFVLQDRREYQLFCHGAGGACDQLFGSFRISAA